MLPRCVPGEMCLLQGNKQKGVPLRAPTPKCCGNFSPERRKTLNSSYTQVRNRLTYWFTWCFFLHPKDLQHVSMMWI